MHKRVATIGVGVTLLAGTAGFALGITNIANAQTGSNPPATAAAPDARGEAKLRQTLQPLLDNNTLTQSQLDAVIKALQDARPAGRPGPGGPGPGGAGALGKLGPNPTLETAAAAIGVTVDDVKAAMKAGQSLADLAKSKGVDPQKVIDALVAPIEKHFADDVTAAKMTQADADTALANAKARIADLVNGVKPPATATPNGPGRGFRPGFGGPGGPGGLGGPGGPGGPGFPGAPKGPAPTAPPTTGAPTTTI